MMGCIEKNHETLLSILLELHRGSVARAAVQIPCLKPRARGGKNVGPQEDPQDLSNIGCLVLPVPPLH